MPAKDQDLIKSMLVKDEKIVVYGRVHPAIYWKSVAILLLGVLFAIFFAVELGILLAVAALLKFAWVELIRHYLLLVLTDKRFLVRYGVLQVDVTDIRFSKIESIELERMLPGQIFGYANVVVMGTGQRLLRIPYIANAAEIRRAYNEMTLADEETEEKKAS